MTLISPSRDPSLAALEDQITWRQMVYAPGMLAEWQPFLVFAATNDPATNQQIAEEARQLGALVDRADEFAASDFHTMAQIERGALILATSTGGVSPALTRHVRERLESAFGAEYTTFTEWLSWLRPRVRQRIKTQPERAALWSRLIDSGVLDALRAGDESAARALFEQISGEVIDEKLPSVKGSQ